MIAIYGPNTINWLLTDIACIMYNICSVPIYDTLGEEACEFMFK
jgi:long-chain acyl-CoA synthetase